MEEDSKKGSTGYWLLQGAASLLALLPFGVLYLLSDIMFVAVYHAARYRRKLVKRNLAKAFPDKSDRERKRIEREFYRHLCDYFVETIKTLRLTEKEVKKRMKFENPEIINRLTKEGNACLLSLGHYANWEWVPSIGLYMLPGVVPALVYKQLHSDAFDRLFRKIRCRFDSMTIEKRRVYRALIRARNEGTPMVVGFLSDQRPPRHVTEYWTTFLNQETLIESGMERIARSFKLPVVYLDMKKVKRGHYVGRFFVITADASQEPPFAVTERYARKLEETVTRDPAYYLWSHNRWRFAREPMGEEQPLGAGVKAPTDNPVEQLINE